MCSGRYSMCVSSCSVSPCVVFDQTLEAVSSAEVARRVPPPRTLVSFFFESVVALHLYVAVSTGRHPTQRRRERTRRTRPGWKMMEMAMLFLKCCKNCILLCLKLRQLVLSWPFLQQKQLPTTTAATAAPYVLPCLPRPRACRYFTTLCVESNL